MSSRVVQEWQHPPQLTAALSVGEEYILNPPLKFFCASLSTPCIVESQDINIQKEGEIVI